MLSHGTESARLAWRAGAQNSLPRAMFTPTHARALAPLLDQDHVCRPGNAAPDRRFALDEFGVAHAVPLLAEECGHTGKGLSPTALSCETLQRVNGRFGAALCVLHGLLERLAPILRIRQSFPKDAERVFQMLRCIPIANNLHGARKCLREEGPILQRSVGEANYFQLRVRLDRVACLRRHLLLEDGFPGLRHQSEEDLAHALPVRALKRDRARAPKSCGTRRNPLRLNTILRPHPCQRLFRQHFLGLARRRRKILKCRYLRPHPAQFAKPLLTFFCRSRRHHSGTQTRQPGRPKAAHGTEALIRLKVKRQFPSAVRVTPVPDQTTGAHHSPSRFASPVVHNIIANQTVAILIEQFNRTRTISTTRLNEFLRHFALNRLGKFVPDQLRQMRGQQLPRSVANNASGSCLVAVDILDGNDNVSMVNRLVRFPIHMLHVVSGTLNANPLGDGSIFLSTPN